MIGAQEIDRLLRLEDAALAFVAAYKTNEGASVDSAVISQMNLDRALAELIEAVEGEP